ncbi:MAG: acyltransferase [Rhodocyclaceae bacterium]|nr:MAG: acyltransferase [Rhodocyclaceae bacterium]
MVTAFLFWGRLLDRRDTMDWLGFFNARIHRLYPVYLLSLSLVFATVLISSGFHVRESFGSLATTLMQWLVFTGATPPLPPDINGFQHTWMLIAGVTWSLRYEWLFYLALPLLSCLFLRSKNYMAGALSLLASLTFVALYGGNEGINVKLLGCFLGGIFAAHWVRNSKLSEISRAWPAGLIAVMTLVATVAWVPANSPLTVAGLTVFFIVVASGQDFRGCLTAPAILLLGEISYGVYLLHGLVIWAMFTQLLPGITGQRFEPSIFFLAVPIASIILVLLAIQASLHIERPGIRLGKRHHKILMNLSNRLAPAR